jgi:hypothetical protein
MYFYSLRKFKNPGHHFILGLIGLGCLGLSACSGPLAEVNVTVVDQKTALENQVLGSYEEIGNDVILLASVRSVDEDGKLIAVTEIPPGKLKAIRARQRQEFNSDDILNFKKQGTTGEGNQGLLVFFETERTRKDPKYKQFVQTLIQEENEDRLAIYERVLATNEFFGEEDLPKIKAITASLNRDNARPGEKIQLPDNSWTVKK